jgi:hypothetical protein
MPFPQNPDEIASNMEDTGGIPSKGQRYANGKIYKWELIDRNYLVRLFEHGTEIDTQQVSPDNFAKAWEYLKDHPETEPPEEAPESQEEAPEPPEETFGGTFLASEDPDTGQSTSEEALLAMREEEFIEWMNNDEFAFKVAKFSTRILARIFARNPSFLKRLAKFDPYT